MKKLLLLLLLLSSTAFAEGPIYNLQTEKTLMVECLAPIDREDGKLLTAGEIVNFTLYHETDLFSWQPSDSNLKCSFFVDLTQLSEGQHHYTTTATDQGGRESILAVDKDPTEKVSFVIQKLPAPLERPSPTTGHTSTTL